MYKKITFLIVIVTGAFILSGCLEKITNQNTNSSGSTSNGQNQEINPDYVTDRTDYVIFFNESSPTVLGGITTHQYIVGRPESEAGTIRYNAYFVPWKIYFSQVQRTSLSILNPACTNLEEQVVYIDGWIDLNLSELAGAGLANLPNVGPANLSGTIHEKVTGTSGTWQCPGSDISTQSVNTGSVQYVQSVSGEHVANFSGASNMTDMTVNGANIYLDLSYEENIQFIWPAGTKIEYAPEGTPIPLEPLTSSSL